MSARRSNLTAFLKSNVGLVFSGYCFTLSIILIMLSRYYNGFSQWYAVNIYPVFPKLIGSVFSRWNYSFFEAGMISLFILLCYILLKSIWIILFHKQRRKKYIFSRLRIAAYILSFMFLIYTLTCSINYQRDSIGTVLKLPVEKVTVGELESLCLLLADELTALTESPEWNDSLRTLDDMAYIKTEAMNSMKNLGKTESSLSGYYSNPKEFYNSKVLSELGIEGIYSPFTMEANYNSDMTPFLVPFTLCHEFAHLKGYMKEEDAGFIAYLASKNSPSRIFQYSGTFHALSFTLNALKDEVSGEEYNKTYRKLPGSIRVQLSYIGEQGREKTILSRSFSNTVNNFYLLANAQYQGSKSYGRMVDLLIAEYRDRLEPDLML